MEDSNDVILKPCPFCGETPSLTHRMDESIWNHNIVPWYYIVCHYCDIEMHECDNSEELIERWNMRQI